MNFKTWIVSTALIAAVGLVFSAVPSFADDGLTFSGYFRQGICYKDDGSRPANIGTAPNYHSTNLPGIGRVGNECDQDIRLKFTKSLIAPREEGGPEWNFVVALGNWSTTDYEVWKVDSEPWPANDNNDHYRQPRLYTDEIFIEAKNVLGKDSVLKVGAHEVKPPGDNHLHDYFWFQESGDGVSYEKKLDFGTLNVHFFRMGGGQGWTGGTMLLDDEGEWSGAHTGTYYSVWLRDIKLGADVDLRLRYGMGTRDGGDTLMIGEAWAWDQNVWENYDAISGNIMTGVVKFKAGGTGHSVLLEQRTGALATTFKNPVEGIARNWVTDFDVLAEKVKTRVDYGSGYNFGKFHTIWNVLYETEDDGNVDESLITWTSIVARGQYHVNKVISYVVEAGHETVARDAADDDKISTKYTGGVVVAADPGWGPSMWVRPLFRFTVSQFATEEGDMDDDYMQYTAFVESWF